MSDKYVIRTYSKGKDVEWNLAYVSKTGVLCFDLDDAERYDLADANYFSDCWNRIDYQYEYQVEQLFEEEKTMSLKVGDIVTIGDYSGCLGIRNEKVEHINLSNIEKELKYRVISIDDYEWPLSKGTIYEHARNNVALVCLNRTNVIVFTNSRFCRIVKPEIKVGDYKVEFLGNNKVRVGCQIIDKETVQKILENI
jgi:hypothetical protein